MCTLNECIGRSLSLDGCQVPVRGGGICGENKTLKITNEFKRLYEEKLHQIECEGSGDFLEEKVKLQEEWISNLTDQNDMLVRAVEELEYEATERVQMLEEKLQQSAKCICEVMKKYREHDVTSDLLREPLQKLFYLENDNKNLLELIRRVRENDDWSLNGLTFYEIHPQDLLVSKNGKPSNQTDTQKTITMDTSENEQGEKVIQDNQCKIRELEKKVDYFCSFGDVQSISENLKCRETECESLKQAMVDMRLALTEEVAVKHDLILSLKRDCHQLEERCQIADKQIVFKDDIIKELRKEIKQLKQQYTQDEVAKLTGTIDDLQSNLQRSKQMQEQEIKQYDDKCKRLIGEVSEMRENLQKLGNKEKEKEAQYKEEVQKFRNESLKLNETITHLKAQLLEANAKENERVNEKIMELKKELLELHKKCDSEPKVCKVCRGRSKVGFTDKPDMSIENCDELSQLEKQLMTISNKEEIIQIQSNTLNILKLELQALKEKDIDLQKGKEQNHQETGALKAKICELECSLRQAEERAKNFQCAVDLYLNSINVLEATNEKSKIESEQQKMTIVNLQEALIIVKQELEGLKQKTEDNHQEQSKLINTLYAVSVYAENQKQSTLSEIETLSANFTQLQHLNYQLEVDQFAKLQEVDDLESLLNKYKKMLTCTQEENCGLRKSFEKLLKQKKCYEEVLMYFREEMKLLSDQLCNLQELLTLSNESCQVENTKLMGAFSEVQGLNERLSRQLNEAQEELKQKNMKNRLYKDKLTKLEKCMKDKNVDVNKHDETLSSIKSTLQHSLKQNEELQSTVSSLNRTICQLQQAIKSFQCETCRTKEAADYCKNQIDSCRCKLSDLRSNFEQKHEELCSMECAYNSRCQELQTTQLELHEMKLRETEMQCHWECTVMELQEKLCETEKQYRKLCAEYSNMQQKYELSRKQELNQVNELKRYRKIISDLKNSMVELNRSLNNTDIVNACNKETCIAKQKLEVESSSCEEEESEEDNECCRCELNYYKSVTESLTKSVVDLKKRYQDLETTKQSLEEDSNRKHQQLIDLTRKQSKKDTDYQELRRQFTEKLRKAQQEEKRYSDLAAQFECELQQIRQELQDKTLQLNDCQKSCHEINSSRCVQLACAQDEINALKTDLNRLLRKHCNLNEEYDKLCKERTQMQCTVTAMEEKNQLIKVQLEHYLAQLQQLQTEKESLSRKNKELLNELRSIHNSYGTGAKPQRYTTDSVKNLEAELDDLKNNRDEICSESKTVISYVRAWLQEQKRINLHIIQREKDYCDTIKKLKQQNEELSRPCRAMKRQSKLCVSFSPPPPLCQSPCSLGSQGTASAQDSDSPSCRSPVFNWFATNFECDESEEDNVNEDDDNGNEDWINKVENLAAQVNRTNRIWEKKMKSDALVTKDKK